MHDALLYQCWPTGRQNNNCKQKSGGIKNTSFLEDDIDGHRKTQSIAIL